MKNIVTRSLTGLTFAALVTAAICFHAYGFLALFTLITGLGVWEFYNCTGAGNRHKWVNVAGGMYLFAATFFYASGAVPESIYCPYLLFILTLFVSGLYLKTPQPVHDWALALFAQLYCAGLLSLLNFTVFSAGIYTPVYPLVIFIFIWLNDTGAYLVGSRWGKRRLFPRISPRKSWEGFCGGLAITLAASLLLARFQPDVLPAWYHWPALATIVVTFGTWGDLVESLLKRTCNIKDSGSLLPGHGGILDRMDSAMLAAPAVFLYLKFFIQN